MVDTDLLEYRCTCVCACISYLKFLVNINNSLGLEMVDKNLENTDDVHIHSCACIVFKL